TYKTIDVGDSTASDCANDDGTKMTPGTVKLIFAKLDPTLGYNTVRVCIRRTSPVLFSGLAGLTSANVSATVKANLIKKPSLYSLMVLSTECNGGSAPAKLNSANVTIDS